MSAGSSMACWAIVDRRGGAAFPAKVAVIAALGVTIGMQATKQSWRDW
jgi:hypothetical protein